MTYCNSDWLTVWKQPKCSNIKEQPSSATRFQIANYFKEVLSDLGRLANNGTATVPTTKMVIIVIIIASKRELSIS